MRTGRRIWISVAGLSLILGWVAVMSAQWHSEKQIRELRKSARAMVTLAQASVRLDVKPKDALVYVDGNLAGTVRDYNGRNERLYLFPGKHTITLKDPDHEPFTTDVSVLPEQDFRLKVRMQKK